MVKNCLIPTNSAILENLVKIHANIDNVIYMNVKHPSTSPKLQLTHLDLMIIICITSMVVQIMHFALEPKLHCILKIYMGIKMEKF